MKIILIIALALLPNTMWSQIDYDKPEQDGTRHIKTSEVFVRRGFDDAMPAYYALQIIQDDDGTSWALSVHLNGAVPDKLLLGSLLMIRTAEGEVLESKNVLEEFKTYDIIHKNIYGLYPFNEEDIKKILSGIAKVRIEAPSELIDIEYNDKRVNKISKELTRRYESIQKLLHNKKSIRSGF